jgi:hypothetical protein
MAKLLKLRRGTTSQHSSFTGAEGEVTVDTDKETLVVHDGSTAGGHPIAAEDMANVSSADIAGRLSNDSIATTKIAAGALPTDVTVASANIVDGTIVNADVNASAAIAGTKISPDFGSQNIVTTGTITTGTINGVLASGVTATTQTASDATTKVATTAFVGTAITNLIDSSPAALNTLNELAAALGDDANFSTTVTNSIATKLATNGDGSSVTNLNASNIASGTIAAARVPTLNQNTTGSAATLTTARTIAGVSFNGSQNISLNNNAITNGAGYTTYTSNQATNTSSNVTFGTINCSSLTSSGNVTAYSDATLKKDVSTINDALSICGKLRGVTYKWISNGETDIGVIAQEVEEVVPEVIKETTDGIKTVDYGRLVSVLINAINELTAQTIILTSEVDTLKEHKQDK